MYHNKMNLLFLIHITLKKVK